MHGRHAPGAYQRDRQAYYERSKSTRLRRSAWYNDYKSNLSCPCGESHVSCIDLHHRDPTTKLAGIAKALRLFSLDKLKLEITKCDPICSNCHLKHHYSESRHINNVTNSHRGTVRKWYNEYKSLLKCQCGEDHPACIQFHHLDPLVKDGLVSDIVRYGTLSQLIAEIVKCSHICSNCHRKLHYIS